MVNYIPVPITLLTDPEWLSIPFNRSMAQIDLLLLAKDGEVNASYRELAKRWKWSVTRVMRFIDELETNGIVECFNGEFHGRLTKHVIRIVSDCYDMTENDSKTYRETFRKESPLSPQSSPGVSPTPPSNSLPIPPIFPQENLGAHSHTGAHMGMGTDLMGGKEGAGGASAGANTYPPTPFPTPFILSSVERSEAMGDPAKIVKFKRMHLAANLAAVATLLCMDATAQKGFLDYWCSPSNRSPSVIRAEGDEFFNLELKARSWMEHEHTPAGAPPTSADSSGPRQSSSSRIKQVADKTMKANHLLNQIYQQNETNNQRRTGASADDHPDEQ